MRIKNRIINTLEVSHGKHTPLYAMEGLRGVAVLMVFWVHYSTLCLPWLVKNSFVGTIELFTERIGHTGVELFFVLSGYLIYGTLIKRESFEFIPYIKRRVKRIYPTYIAVYLIYVALSLLIPSESKLPEGVANTLLYLLQNILLLPGLFDIQPMITISWTLSYELFFYLSIPIVIQTLGMKKWSKSIRIQFWIVAAVVGFGYFYLFHHGPLRALMFVAGIVLYEIHTADWVLPISKFGILFFVIGYVIAGLRPFLNIPETLVIAGLFVFFLLGCYSAFQNESTTHAILSWRPLRLLGNMSYSYYLFHGLTLKILFTALSLVIPPSGAYIYLYFWLWIPFVSITLISSYLFFSIIEKPFSLTKKN